MGHGSQSVWDLPFLVPPEQPIELFFFRRVFHRLRELRGEREQAWKDSNTWSRLGPSIDRNIRMKNQVGDEQREDVRHLQGGKNSRRHKTSFDGEANVGDFSDQEVSLFEFHRAMLRLFKTLGVEPPAAKIISEPGAAKKFNVLEYDVNENGSVGWFEFCSFWKNRAISVQLTIAERVYLTFDSPERSILGWFMSRLILVVILISFTSFILATHPDMMIPECELHESPDELECRTPDSDAPPTAFKIFSSIDMICVIFFTLEFLIRLVTSSRLRSELVERDKAQLLEWMVSDEIIEIPTPQQRLYSFMTNISNIIDVLSIMPWYVQTFARSMGMANQSFMAPLRLFRIIRVFRLGRRFEAVIIIMRTIRRSVKAITVLVLNLSLGMTIFGALMYSMEQKVWDSEKRAYMRYKGEEFWNETSMQWEDGMEKTPFESIPACFWWAIVTATTVGYGSDRHMPTSWHGRIIGMLAMVWSLVVLALPIGVIGANFSMVYDEYDYEKLVDEENRLLEADMLKRCNAWGDPLHYSRRIIIEVWHDSDPDSPDKDLHSEFMGEVEAVLDLPPKNTVTKRRVKAPLVANMAKGRRNVRGRLTFEYSWTPLFQPGTDAVLSGTLEITIESAEHLVNIDWTGSSLSDPYFVLLACPQSPEPSGDGAIIEVRQRSVTITDSIDPVWNAYFRFEVLWLQAGIDMRKKNGPASPSLRQVAAGQEGDSARKGAGIDWLRDSDDDVIRVLPEIQDRCAQLKSEVPKIQNAMLEVRQDLQSILTALAKQPAPAG